MTTKQEQFEKNVAEFGGCPVCHTHGMNRDIGRDHWFACDVHKKKWCVGSNIFSAWQKLSEEAFEENRRILADYEEVVPWHPGDGMCYGIFWKSTAETLNCGVCEKSFGVSEGPYLAVGNQGCAGHRAICRQCGAEHALDLFEFLWLGRTAIASAVAAEARDWKAAKMVAESDVF